MTCPQCHQRIEGSACNRSLNPSLAGRYAVGWCQLDIHVDCLWLHVRACAACRPHNEVALSRRDAHLRKWDA